MTEAPLDAKAHAHDRLGGSLSYTGANTRESKGAVRVELQKNPNHIMAALSGYFHACSLVASPMYHAMTFVWCTALKALDATDVFMPEFDGEQALAAIPRFKVNGFFMPPIVLKRLLHVPEITMCVYSQNGHELCSCLPDERKNWHQPAPGGVMIMDPEHALS